MKITNCPHCGSMQLQVLQDTIECPTLPYNYNDCEWHVECMDCFATSFGKTKAEAILNWNRRFCGRGDTIEI